MVSGTTTIGALTLTPASAQTVIFNGTSATAITSVGAISQNGANALAVTQSGSGTTILSGNNTYTGATVINAGVVEVSADANLGSGNLTLGGELLTSANFTTSKTVTLSSNAAILAAANVTTAIYNGAIGGSDMLTVGDSTNQDTVVLAGNNTYTGDTTITSSTLAVGSLTALSTGFVINNGMLEAFGSQHVIQVLTNYTQGTGGPLLLNLNSNPVPGNTNDVLKVTGNAILAQDFSQNGLPHADTTTGAGSVGVNYRITPHLCMGALFNYGHTDANLDTNGSTASADSYSPVFS